MDNKFFNFQVFINDDVSTSLIFKPCYKYKINDPLLNLEPKFRYGRVVMSGTSIDDPTEEMYYMVSWDDNTFDGPYNQKQMDEFRLNKIKYHSEKLKLIKSSYTHEDKMN
jgi:hypothetical protein